MIGNPGANQILIGLLLPAVQVNPAAAPVQPRKADPPGKLGRSEGRHEMRNALIAALLFSTAASAMPTAVETGPVVAAGQTFQKGVVLETAVLCDGSVRLEKGTYDVKFESLGKNKVRATFFQGGAKKGEASGIIAIDGSAGHVRRAVHRRGPEKNISFNDLGLHPSSAHALQKQGDKLNLVVGNQGSNQILIGLLLPAVQKGIIGPTRHAGRAGRAGRAEGSARQVTKD